MKTTLTTLAALLATGLASAQTGDLTVVHGLPGLSGPVDVVANGNTVLSGAVFGDSQTFAVAPGAYNIDIVLGGNVVLNTSTNVAVDESVTVAAHLLDGGGSDLTVFQNDLGAVSVAGDCRVSVRHLADAQILVTALDSPNGGVLSFLFVNGIELPLEVSADDWDTKATPFTGGNPFPFPGGGTSTGSITVAQDEGLIVYVVGTPGTPSFRMITQDVTLAPATPTNPQLCDLTLSGSIIGGSLSTGGTLNLDLTNSVPGSFAIYFLAFDNSPSTFFNVNLGIGANGIIPLGFDLVDNMGMSSLTQNYPPVQIGGTPIPMLLDLYSQAASIDFGGSVSNFNLTCLSDIEAFQVNWP